MRILFLSHYFPPEVNAPASRTYELCKRWVRRGHEVTVITSAPNAPDGVLYPGYRNRLVQREMVDGIEVVRVWTYLAANKGTVRRMVNYVSYMVSASLCSLFVRRPDVVIATTPQLFCGWAGAFAHWTRRRPFILEVRDMWAESIFTLTSVKGGRLLRFAEWLEFKLYGLAPTIVTVGEGYKSRLAAGGVDPAKMVTITNGVDREFFAPREPDRELADRWNLTGKFVCTYAGTIGLAHGLEVVLRAAELLRDKGRSDVVFLLVGEGARREELEAQARAMKLDNVIFAGKQPKGMMPRIHSISDCSLVHLRKAPLYTSVLPSKIFEVAHMKRPILLGVDGEAAKIIRESNCGICIEPENETQLVDAVQRLASDPALCRSLGEAGHRYVACRFDRDQLALDYLGVIAQATGHLTEDVSASAP